jgi:hypothetical protein
MSDYLYQPGSGLEVPGVEGVLEYGDVADYDRSSVPGALRINDRSMPDQVHVSELSGLHDDPDVSDSRTERAGNYGERTGLLFPRGRTVGVTGYVKAGNVGRMRDLWRRTRAQFGRSEHDLIVHPPGEATLYRNEVWMDPAVWTGVVSNVDPGTITPLAAYTEGNLVGIQHAVSFSLTTANSLVLMSKRSIPWRGQNVGISALAKVQAAAAATASLSLAVYCCDDDDNVLGVWAPPTPLVTAPVTGTYYQLKTLLTPGDLKIPGTRFYAAVVMTTSGAAGAFTLRAAQVTATLVDAEAAMPSGYVSGSMPGYEWEGVPDRSRSYGPCYAVNQAYDPDSEDPSLWGNNSTAGVTVEVASSVVRSWPGNGRSSSSWRISNPNTTSRVIGFRLPGTLADPKLLVVNGGRSYRAHVKVRVDEAYTTGGLYVVWLDHNLAFISETLIDVFNLLAAGATPVVTEIDGTAVAPALAQRAYLSVRGTTPSTVANNRMSLLLAEPRFVDVSEHDSGGVAIDSTQDREHGISQVTPSMTAGVLSTTPAGARRRIPRPFALRKVRALWDGKAPESQRTLSARRDFTMSLRAADPLIYPLDERHAFVRASGTPKMSSLSMSSFGALLSSTPSLVASDNFDDAPTGSFNGRTAVLGGSWVTSGTSPMTVTTFGPLKTIGATAASDAAPRFAILGATNYVNVRVEALGYRLFGGGLVEQGVIARWTDSSNYLRALAYHDAAGGTVTLRITQRVAGTDTILSSAVWPANVLDTFYCIRLIVTPSGRVMAWLLDEGKTTTMAYVETSAAALATGGTLATGKFGLYDTNTSASTSTRLMDDFLAYTSTADVAGPPANFVAEGTSLDIKTGWVATAPSGAPYPRSGVAIAKTPPHVGYLSQASLMRAYFLPYTYTTPQVTVAGDCVSPAGGHDYDLFSSAYIGNVWQYNYLAAVIKRVSATTWLELRYNSANWIAMNLSQDPPTTSAPYSLELWCSHNTAGTLVSTRLDGWDVPVDEVTSGALKFVRGYMTAGDEVVMELWSGSDPNPGDVGLLSRRSYQLTSSLPGLVGAGVSGSTGFAVRLGRWSDGGPASVSLEQMASNYGFPYMASFDTIDYAATQLWLSCPVIGDADEVPWQLQLRGSIDSPTIVLISFGEEVRTSTVRLSGVFTDTDPVTIDFDTGKIRSANGVNRFSSRQPGSRFEKLTAGQNFVLIQATAWDTAATVHAIATWRDALI